jgi:hypothetical protein
MSLQNEIKVLVAAPGSLYSTFDIYRYYMVALERNPYTAELVSGFAFHNLVLYHQIAQEEMANRYGWPAHEEFVYISRAARELLLEIYLEKPDVVWFIDGSKYPPALYKEIHKMLRELNRNTVVACYLTEAPYIEEPISVYENYLDVIFTNDLYDYQRRNPEEKLAVYYLPHSYSEDVHYPADKEEYEYDVLFCGTVFEERAYLLEKVDWSGIRVKIIGSWMLTPEDIKEKMFQAGIGEERIVDNQELSDLYRKSKIVININRTTGWDKYVRFNHIDSERAYSMGPRIVEATACGALVVSDYRPEIEAVYGDAIPIFSNAGELEKIIRHYLEHETERKQKAAMAQEKTKGMSYDNRLENIILPAFWNALAVKVKTRR